MSHNFTFFYDRINAILKRQNWPGHRAKKEKTDEWAFF